MALNIYSNNEAIERVIAIRDKLKLDNNLDLKSRWADKDALSQVINLVEYYLQKEKIKE